MKRFTRSESLDTLIPTHHQPKEEDEKNNTRDNGGYSKDFQAMLDSYDQEDSGEEVSVKKRRLSLHQVKALEISFEVENKLEPERKVKLAEELGLEPRQVAIWFQNRRARWKTKQLEKDYSLMKAEYDALKDNYDGLEKQNKVLAEKLKELKAKMCRDNAESDRCVKEESPISVYKSNVMEQSREQEMSDNGDEAGLDMISKDGSSNSEESNGAMKEEENNENYESSMVYNGASLSSNSMMNWFQVSDSSSGNKGYHHHHHQSQPVRMEEQNLFSTEESCNFFSVDQAPSLHW